MNVQETFLLRDGLAEGQRLIYHTPEGVRYLKVLYEVDVDGTHYAIMRQDEDHPEDAYLFRIHDNQAYEIEDEEEWETIVDCIEEHLNFYYH